MALSRVNIMSLMRNRGLQAADRQQPKAATETRIDGEEANPTAVVASGNNLYVTANNAGLVRLSR